MPGTERSQETHSTIVVVDDNLVNATLISHLVARHGHAVEILGSGFDAVHRVATGGVDAMFLDLHMPDMDGFDTTRAIRVGEASSSIRMPIIAVTADLNQDLLARALAAGMDDLMRKPVSVAAIASILERRLPRAPRQSSVRESSGSLPICLPPFDPTVLQAAESSAPGSAGRILRTFIADLGHMLEALPDLVGRKAFLNAQHLVHQVRSSAISVGCPQLAHVLGDLESGLRTGDQLHCLRSLRAARAAREQFCTTLELEGLTWPPGLNSVR